MTHTDRAEDLVRASPAEVFDALVDETARAAWLPPAGMTGRFDWFDPRPGGGYRMTLTYDDDATPGKSGDGTDVVEVRFVEVERPSLVVEEADFVSDDPDLAGTMTMAWTLEPADGATIVSVTATDVPDGISSDDHVAAFTSTLDNLGRYVDGSST